MSGKAKHSIKLKKEIADSVNLIILRLKEEYKNLDINDLSKSNDLVLQVMELVEELSNKGDLSKKTVKSLNKNELVVQIFQSLFPDLVAEDLGHIEEMMQFIINSKLLKHSGLWGKVKKPLKFFCSILKLFS